MAIIDAVDVPDTAEWGLVSDEAQKAAGREPGCIFRAVYEQHGLRHTSFFEPQEVLHILNRHSEPLPR